MNKRMNKEQRFPGMEKHEKFIGQFKDYQMASLIARRLHNYFNEKMMRTSFNQKKIHFITSSGDGNTKVFVGCDRPISPIMEMVVAKSAKRFEEELKPYFKRSK